MDTFALQFLQPGNRTPLRIAAYIRISGEEERKDSGSFHTQQHFFTSLIQSCPDWKLAGIYGDYAKTGTQIAGRHAFQQMLRDAARGKMDYILTKSVSRFARNAADCLESIRKLTACHVGIYFMEQGLDTGKTYGELLLTVLATIAEMEAESIRENLLQLHRAMNARGTPVLPARYGYRREKLAWQIVPQEAVRVRLAFLMAASGYRLSVITRKLNELERKEQTEKHWTLQSVRTLLSNEIYAGDILTNKHCSIRNQKGKQTVRNNGLVDQFYIYDHHPALIGRVLYQQVSRLLHNKQLFGQRHFSPDALQAAQAAANRDPLLDDRRSLLQQFCFTL